MSLLQSCEFRSYIILNAVDSFLASRLQLLRATIVYSNYFQCCFVSNSRENGIKCPLISACEHMLYTIVFLYRLFFLQEKIIELKVDV